MCWLFTTEIGLSSPKLMSQIWKRKRSEREATFEWFQKSMSNFVRLSLLWPGPGRAKTSEGVDLNFLQRNEGLTWPGKLYRHLAVLRLGLIQSLKCSDIWHCVRFSSHLDINLFILFTKWSRNAHWGRQKAIFGTFVFLAQAQYRYRITMLTMSSKEAKNARDWNVLPANKRDSRE
jgi:hypothetical protein